MLQNLYLETIACFLVCMWHWEAIPILNAFYVLRFTVFSSPLMLYKLYSYYYYYPLFLLFFPFFYFFPPFVVSSVVSFPFSLFLLVVGAG